MVSPRINRRMLFALAAGGMTSAMLLTLSDPVARADEGKKIELAKVPAKAKEAATKAVPGARWTGASQHEEDGEITFELEGTDAEKRYVWAEVSAEGEVEEVGTEIPMKQVPVVVTAKLKASLPRFVSTTVYEARQDGKAIRYDFEGKRPRDKEEITVSISADGKEIEIDAD
jgi:hypothetical protein